MPPRTVAYFPASLAPTRGPLGALYTDGWYVYHGGAWLGPCDTDAEATAYLASLSN